MKKVFKIEDRSPAVLTWISRKTNVAFQKQFYRNFRKPGINNRKIFEQIQ